MANVNTIMTEEFDEYVKGLMAEFKVPGAAVALLTPSETNIKTFNLPNYPSITETTRFAVSSCTKLVNALAVYRALQEAGYDQGFSTRVRDILPDFKLSNETTAENATVGDILAHRCRVPQYDTFACRPLAPGENMLQRVEGMPHTGELGEFPSNYNNMIQSQSLLIIEKITGRPYREYVKSTILLPLGMNSTGWSVEEAGEDMALGWQARHTPEGLDERLMWLKHPYDVLGQQVAVASIRMVSTVGDMAKLLAHLPNNPAWKEMHIPDEDPASTILPGGVVSKEVNGIGSRHYQIGQYRFEGHTGICAGFRTRIVRNEELDFGIVILTNSTEGVELALCIQGWLLSRMTGDDELKEKVYQDMLKDRQERHEKVMLDHPAVQATATEKILGTFSSPSFGTLVFDESSNIPKRPACNLFDSPWMAHLYGKVKCLITSVGEGKFQGCIEWKSALDQDQSGGEVVYGWPFVIQAKGEDEIEVFGMGIGLPRTMFAVPPAVFTRVVVGA